MWRFLKFLFIFLLSCIFILPLLNIEDPLRTISLSFWGKETKAKIVEHICKPDRTYWYEYLINGKSYRQQYNGYVEKLDQQIPENERCKGVLQEPAEIEIKYFPMYSFWSEPLDHIDINFLEKIMYILIKIIGILILMFTFFRK
ncbi:MAG: hypothetical protein ABI851_09865 [Saprospiraceae bacterium]